MLTYLTFSMSLCVIHTRMNGGETVDPRYARMSPRKGLLGTKRSGISAESVTGLVCLDNVLVGRITWSESATSQGNAMVQVDEVRGWIGRAVVDPSGHKVGTVSHVFVDDETNSPEWATVDTGLFGRRSSFIPIEGVSEEGDDLLIPWDREQVKGAPQVDDDDDGHLTPEEEVKLYRYYAREQRLASDADVNGRGETQDANRNTERATDEDGLNSELPRSGQARLRKYVVTEEVHPVSRVLVDDSPADETREPSNGQ